VAERGGSGKARPSGLPPHLFFWLVVVIFVIVIGGFWILKGVKAKETHSG